MDLAGLGSEVDQIVSGFEIWKRVAYGYWSVVRHMVGPEKGCVWLAN